MDTHVARYERVTAGFRYLNQAQPGVMKGFGRQHREALTEGPLTHKDKELMALAISVVQRCGDWVSLQAHDAAHAGASEVVVAEAVAAAILMGGGPAAVYGPQGRDADAEFAAAGEAVTK